MAAGFLLGAGFCLWRKGRPPSSPGWRAIPFAGLWRRRRRFRRVFPLLFALTATLAAIGGALYTPTNFDALSYRFSRVLYWWDHAGWHWINAGDLFMNSSGTVFEWLMLPLLAFTHSDRFFFLINVTSYLLMPGLVFGVLRGVGVAGRVAWVWMWLLPMGFCYAVQAASIGNDLTGATYVLAAVSFALQAHKTGKVQCLWLALLAAGLATGVKAPILPLLLPMACAIYPALGLLRWRLAGSLAVVFVSLLISFAPIALLNEQHTGSWTGDPRNQSLAQIKGPVVGLVGNSLLITTQTLAPPFFPWSRRIGDWIWKRTPQDFGRWLEKGFPRFKLRLHELPIEEAAGLGLPVALLIGAATVVALGRRGRASVAEKYRWRQSRLIEIGAWLALLAYLIKIGSADPARLLSAYYPLLLIPILLSPAQKRLVAKRWFKWAGVLAGIGALAAVALTPARPLLPAGTFFNWLAGRYPGNGQIQRAKAVYEVYSNRGDVFASLRAQIPESVRTIGFIAEAGYLETSLWRPFGRRRVVHIIENHSFERPQTEWVVARNKCAEAKSGVSFEEWVRQTAGEVVAQTPITTYVHMGPEQWSIVHYRSLAQNNKQGE